MNKSNHPKKVTVLTGFLGSGKTTLLNAILQRKSKTRFAIIENEVGKIGIDGELIIKNMDSFTELNNGCICCSINDNFNDTLKDLSEREDWDELIIEATGIANPGGILSPFLTFPWMLKHFQTPEVICIADAQNIEEQLQISDIAATQMAYGNKIYINKIDLVAKDQVQNSISLVQRFNPFANIHTGSRHDIPLAALIESDGTTTPNLEPKNTKTDHKHHHSHDHFDAVSLEYKESFQVNQLYAKLYYHIVMGTMKLYRFKGIFYDASKSEKIIIQSAMQSLLIEDGLPWKEEEPRISKFVFIGKNLKSEELDEILKSCYLSTTNN